MSTTYDFKDIEVFNTTNAALVELTSRFSVVPNGKTKEGYAEIKAGCKELQTIRKAIETARKEKTEEWRAMTAAVNTEGKRITDVIVALEGPFKDAKKAIDDEEARIKAERIAKLQKKVDDLGVFITDAKGKSSDEIQCIMEAVDMIDTSEDFYDLEPLAIKKRGEVLAELADMLTSQMAFEDAAEETARLKAEKEESDRLQKIADDKQKVQNSINELLMIPVDFIGKTSDELQAKIDDLGGFEIDLAVYDTRASEAQEALDGTVAKLTAMHAQQVAIESIPVVPEPVVEAEQESNEDSAMDSALQFVTGSTSSELEKSAENNFEAEDSDKLDLTTVVNALNSVCFYVTTMRTERGRAAALKAERALESIVDTLKADIEKI